MGERQRVRSDHHHIHIHIVNVQKHSPREAGEARRWFGAGGGGGVGGASLGAMGEDRLFYCLPQNRAENLKVAG